MRTKTSFTTFQQLQAREDEAVLIVKLMMAFNDLALANECLSYYKPLFDKNRDNKDRGAAMYFIRLTCSHLFEAMTIIDAIAQRPGLREMINRCSENAKTAFDSLMSIRQDKEERAKFERVIGRLRSNLTFHYEESGSLIRKAIGRRAKSKLGNPTSITSGTDSSLWRFTIADDVMDSIACREIWNIPETTDVRTEADKVMTYGHEIFVHFANFASEFVFKWVTEP